MIDPVIMSNGSDRFRTAENRAGGIFHSLDEI
jgi:hypothetical protein